MESSFIIRRAEVRDIPDIIEMILALRRIEENLGCNIFSDEDTFTRASISEVIETINKENYVYLVAQMGHRIVGYASGFVYPPKRTYRYRLVATAEATFVWPDVRNRRVAVELQSEFRKIVKTMGAEMIRCVCVTENSFSIRKLLEFGMHQATVELHVEI